MIDIVSVGTEIGVFDTQTSRAANILSVQLGSLEYAPDLGVDLKYFLSEDFRFQNESFKSYLIQVLANHSINVVSIPETITNLYNRYVFQLTPAENENAMIAR